MQPTGVWQNLTGHGFQSFLLDELETVRNWYFYAHNFSKDELQEFWHRETSFVAAHPTSPPSQNGTNLLFQKRCEVQVVKTFDLITFYDVHPYFSSWLRFTYL